MRMIGLLLLVIMAIRPTAAQAEPACDKLSKTIAGSQLRMIDSRMSELASLNDVNVSIVQELKINNELLLIQANFTIMIQAHCPLPTTPLEDFRKD